jgi:hypothetical protein
MLIAQLQVDISGASTEEIIAVGQKTVRVLVEGELAEYLKLAQAGLNEYKSEAAVPIATFEPKKQQELASLLSFFLGSDFALKGDPDQTVSAQNIADALALCIQQISAQSGMFVTVVSTSVPDASKIHIERAYLSGDLARFDLLMSYLELVNEIAQAN